MVHKTLLAAKVAAKNNANAYGLKLYPLLADYFRPLIGQKIVKVDGTLLKKITDAMPSFPPTGKKNHELGVHRLTSDYSLAWVVKACESSPGKMSHPGDEYQIASYYEATVYVGQMRDGVLMGIYNPPEFRTDYTAEEVEKARGDYQKAKAAMSSAFSALDGFGEYDI